MVWSTRQLAELAGTTVKTVRHYHRMGLLDLPDRTANGYKQYRMTHLVRLLRIKRLTDLGLSLARIRAMGAGDGDPGETVRALEDELAARADRLQRIRGELAVLREHGAPLDSPARLGSVAGGLSEEDRAMLTVVSGSLPDHALDDLRQLIAEPTDRGTDEDFDRLAEDADDATIEDIAGRLAESVRRSHARFPWMADPGSAGTRGREFAETAMGSAVVERFNAAQLKALALVHAQLAAQDR
ncbi:MerR family transcriptional regulator [Amycolatopsis sp. PS_44_ISF1]|uniref:helix-turn-helix domain-containing protein n=1 Tax=Amycolatopsis sp. PS_44_ISF1 TaxID=2974917 RepID=UPI0028E06FB3|nr:MerR family transcriptional regulator [Amycolatopsis sp. PS_44_ISF1]MDT8912328.1 MerR family transcriptional regulator [Amycolatopsis sp. PS_44_ISF1]